MTTTPACVQRFLPAPSIVAADRLARGITTADLTLTVDGPAGSRPIVGDLCATSLPATWRWRRRQGRAWLDITPASSWRCELSIQLDGAPRAATAHLQAVLDRAVAMVERVDRSAPAPGAVAPVRRPA
jgi:hypothetical protein